jgi:hypothetical protein
MKIEETTHGLTRECEIVLAVFALGRFIDYRIEEGMAHEDLKEFKQAWLSMKARHRGEPPPLLQDLIENSRTLVLTPQERACVDHVDPAWLPDAERLNVLRRSLANWNQEMPTIEQAANMYWSG